MDEQVVPFLRVTDAEAAAEWYARLGFTIEWRHRFAPGLPLFLALARGEMRLFLSEHIGDATPDTLVYLYLRDITPIAAEFDATVQEAPWGSEIELRDPDGNRLRIGTPSDED